MPVVRPVYPNELYHYGVKGMHWGIRRYQPYPKGYSGSGKYLGKRSKVGLFGKKTETKVRRLTDDDKMRLIRDGSSDDLLKYSSQLSTNELSEGLRRLQTKRALSNEKSEIINSRIKRISTPLGEAGKILKSGTQFYEFANARSKGIAKRNNTSSGYDWNTDSNYFANPDWGRNNQWGKIAGGKKVDSLSRKKRVKGQYRDAWNESAKILADKHSESELRRGRNISLARGLGNGAWAGYEVYRLRKSNSKLEKLARGALATGAGVRSFGYLGGAALGTTALRMKKKTENNKKKRR